MVILDHIFREKGSNVARLGSRSEPHRILVTAPACLEEQASKLAAADAARACVVLLRFSMSGDHIIRTQLLVAIVFLLGVYT